MTPPTNGRFLRKEINIPIKGMNSIAKDVISPAPIAIIESTPALPTESYVILLQFLFLLIKLAVIVVINCKIKLTIVNNTELSSSITKGKTNGIINFAIIGINIKLSTGLEPLPFLINPNFIIINGIKLNGGNNNSGSLVNGVGFNSYQNSGFLTFDGVDDRVATSFKPSGYRSYFVWIKYNITSSLPAGYSLTGTQEGNAYNYVGIENGGKFYYYFGTNGQSLGGTVLSPNVWYYQGLTLSSDGNARAYLNDTLVSTLASGVGSTATAEFSVGCINQNYWVNGSIASVMQYNRTLTQAEITQNFNAQRNKFGV